ncbi:MAG TPA: hypothetical protein PK018_04950 [Candidatus Competibacter sp.]|nr:hypothetical protein [Candidatus Competibacteraceae bacterium]HPE71514.1 hypothetical protein [Candidatus Competibacter sp.]
MKTRGAIKDNLFAAERHRQAINHLGDSLMDIAGQSRYVVAGLGWPMSRRNQ